MPDWYKKVLLIPSFILLFSISIVFAVPPITQTFLGDIGLQVKYPALNIIKHGSDIEFSFHIYNLTSGKPITNGITCYYHLYNNTGEHILELEDSTSSTSFDYEFDVGSNNFSYIGSYCYLISCNTSTEGGFAEVPFKVTETGKAEPIQDTEDEYFLYFVFILAIILLLISFYKNDHNLASISGMVLIILGGYIIAYGFSTLTNMLSNGLGIVLIGIGIYILLRSNIDYLTGG